MFPEKNVLGADICHPVLFVSTSRSLVQALFLSFLDLSPTFYLSSFPALGLIFRMLPARSLQSQSGGVTEGSKVLQVVTDACRRRPECFWNRTLCRFHSVVPFMISVSPTFCPQQLTLSSLNIPFLFRASGHPILGTWNLAF